MSPSCFWHGGAWSYKCRVCWWRLRWAEFLHKYFHKEIC